MTKNEAEYSCKNNASHLMKLAYKKKKHDINRTLQV